MRRTVEQWDKLNALAEKVFNGYKVTAWDPGVVLEKTERVTIADGRTVDRTIDRLEISCRLIEELAARFLDEI